MTFVALVRRGSQSVNHAQLPCEPIVATSRAGRDDTAIGSITHKRR